ncbi:MAG: excinuclease ABC subunit UvrB [Candidatus Delongbacteria bacterium]
MSGGFTLISEFEPCGDQGDAIRQLAEGFAGPPGARARSQVLLGVTGSGKTYTVAQLVARLNRPTLVLSHNKTLAAQLYGELKGFFPQNAVEFFISYYDYYQPEAYLPSSDTYIEKDSAINAEIDRLRLKATSSLLERRDVLIVASVSAIYGLGNPEEYRKGLVLVRQGEQLDRRELLRRLVDVHYTRAGAALERGTFRVNGDVLEIQPAYEETALRLDTFGDELQRIQIIDPLTGKVLGEKPAAAIYPAKHFVTDRPSLERAVERIELELEERLAELEAKGKVLEAHRLRQRTRFDLEMMLEIGYCSGIENYSRHLDGREPGSRPACLLDYFPDDLLVVVDESHVTLPQLRAMYRGDRVRKETLVDYGFRLPCALDNRPLTFDEFESLAPDLLYVSATPGDYELARTGGVYVEQLIRPTGLLDPAIDVRPSEGQIEDLAEEIGRCTEAGDRVLVTTLTKRMAEDLATFLGRRGIRVRYLHSDIESLKRVELVRDLRLGVFDVLVGVNLLREGLDLPEVALVVVLDADKEGFLRSARSLFQIVGRAARHEQGRVIFYADRVSAAMEQVLAETVRRRALQADWNTRHGVTPHSVRKSEDEIRATTTVLDEARKIEDYTKGKGAARRVAEDGALYAGVEESCDPELLRTLMEEAAARLDFERAARLRDRLRALDGGEADPDPAPDPLRQTGRQAESRLQAKRRGKDDASRAMKKLQARRSPTRQS